MEVRLAYRSLMAVLLLGCLLASCGSDEPDPARTPVVASKPQPILSGQQILDEVHGLRTKWKGVVVTEASALTVSVRLLYRDMPSGLPEVEADTKAVARAVLRILIAQGHVPVNERTMVFVHAHKPEKGETGADVVRVFGTSIYHYTNDQIEFEPPER